MPKAMCKLEADLALPLATHPREHNTTLCLIPEALHGVTDDALQLLKKICASGEQWIGMASHHPMLVGGKGGGT